MEKCKILAHRGFSGRYPENTRTAFVAASEIPWCDGFETDVHMTADGHVVVIHDASLKRTSTGSGLVCRHTYKELLTYDYGIKFSKQFKGERIMLLSELLEFVQKRRLFLNIELKNNEIEYPMLEQKVISMIADFRMENNVLLSSFNHRSMRLCKQIHAGICTALLYIKPLIRAERYAAFCGADALHPYHKLLKMEHTLFTRAHDTDIKIGAWTVNRPADYLRLANSGAYAVITDFPDRLGSVGNTVSYECTDNRKAVNY